MPVAVALAGGGTSGGDWACADQRSAAAQNKLHKATCTLRDWPAEDFAARPVGMPALALVSGVARARGHAPLVLETQRGRGWRGGARECPGQQRLAKGGKCGES